MMCATVLYIRSDIASFIGPLLIPLTLLVIARTQLDVPPILDLPFVEVKFWRFI